MLKAFLSQSKINDIDADKRQEAEKLSQDIMMQRAMLQLASSQKISEHINIPSQLSNGELNNKIETHKNLNGYDHSLEKTRIKFKTIKNTQVGDINEVMNNMFNGSNDVD